MPHKDKEVRLAYQHAYAKRYYTLHREKKVLSYKKWELAHPDYRREQSKAKREKKFGVVYPAETTCVRCGRYLRGKEIELDHNHKTGQFRGWLCKPCNVYLGGLEKNVSKLLDDLQYIGLEQAQIFRQLLELDLSPPPNSSGDINRKED